MNGCILLGAERYRRRAEVRELARREGAKADGGRKLDTLDYREAAIIGVAQSSALIAGISRDGVCMASGLVRGLDNADAGRFAFLLATPPILAAGLFKFGDLTGPLGNGGVRGAALIAAGVAAITAVFAVHFLMRYLRTGTLKPFGIYCIVFGALVVSTIKQVTGLSVNHVVVIDFNNFVRAVNEIGCVYGTIDRRYFHVNVPGGPSIFR